jgi:hypothetical protein
MKACILAAKESRSLGTERGAAVGRNAHPVLYGVELTGFCRELFCTRAGT